jgi:succinoglycan biosynthesis transport protein ExoP
MTHRDPNYSAAVPAIRPAVDALTIRSARPAVLTATPGALCLLKALKRRWAPALGLGLLLAAVAGGAAYVLVPGAKYTASASLHVATKPKRIIFEPQERETDFRTYQKTQTTLLKNHKILADTLAKPEVASLATVREQIDPEEWLDQALKAEFPGGSEVLQVTITGDRAEDLAKVVNAVVQSYKSLVVDDERRERVSRLDALMKLREKYDADLKVKRRSLKDTVANVGLADEKALAASQQYKTDHLGMARRERMQAQSVLLKAQAEVSVLESSAVASRPRLYDAPGAPRELASTPAPAAVDLKGVDRDPRIVAIRNEAAKVRDKIREGEGLARNGRDPYLLKLKNRLASLDGQHAEERRAVAAEMASASSLAARVGPVTVAEAPGLTDLARAQAKVAVWKSYGEALSEDIERLQSELKETSDKGLDLENERAEIAIATEVARKVGAEIEAVQVELQAPERITLLAEAKIPNKKDELRKLKAAAGAAMGVFACALMGMAFWEFRARRVDDALEVVNGLGLRLMGTLPALPRRNRLAITLDVGQRDRRWQNRLVESVDAMRALLLHASRSDGTRTVMVTSAIKGEGKTSLACHLATSLARGGRRTLLIDGDLRSPACHRLFGGPSGPGLCEALRGEMDVEDAIYAGLELGPELLPAGRMDPLALQALTCDGLRSLLDKLKHQYEFIIVDSAPVLPVADSLSIGQAVDAVIFSVMRGVSRLPMVYEAHERLDALGVRTLGAVVAGVHNAQAEYEYQS